MNDGAQLLAYSTGERDRVNGNDCSNPYDREDILWGMYDDGYYGHVFTPWAETH